MLEYLFRYIKAQVYLKTHPDIPVPHELPVFIQETLDHVFEQVRIKEEWHEIWEKQGK